MDKKVDYFTPLAYPLRGAADVWDQGPAGAILTAEYFDSAPVNQNEATLSKALAGATVSASGTVAVKGTLASSLSASVSSTGAVLVKGSATGGLSASVASTAQTSVKGTAAGTLISNITASGTVAVKGSANNTLQGAETVSSGIIPVAGEQVSILGSSNLESLGSIAVSGSYDGILDDAYIESTSQTIVSGSYEVELDGLGVVSNGQVYVSGNLNSQLNNITVTPSLMGRSGGTPESISAIKSSMLSMLAGGNGWVVGTTAVNNVGKPVSALHPSAVKWDIWGALTKAASNETDFSSQNEILRRLTAGIPSSFKSKDLDAYNDDSEWSDVLALINLI